MLVATSILLRQTAFILLSRQKIVCVGGGGGGSLNQQLLQSMEMPLPGMITSQ